MRTLFERMHGLCTAGKNMVLACVLKSEGSAPGKPGALMLVGPQGLLWGTIGGGAVEHRAIQLAAAVLDECRSRTQEFQLTNNDAQQLGMVCGGSLAVCFMYLPAGQGLCAFSDTALDLIERGDPTWLVLAAGKGPVPLLALFNQAGEAAALYADAPGKSIFPADPTALKPLLRDLPVAQMAGTQWLVAQPLVPLGRVVIFGGGHVAQQLVPILSRVGFWCAVYEDRPKFAAPELFPDAPQIILGDYTHIAAHISIAPQDYVVVVTRGHAADFEVERQVLRLPTAYVGVIGSKKKTLSVNQQLLADGIPQSVLDGVYTPIGLAIGAQTPAEIAVSIAAQLIQVRASQASPA